MTRQQIDDACERVDRWSRIDDVFDAAAMTCFVAALPAVVLGPDWLTWALLAGGALVAAAQCAIGNHVRSMHVAIMAQIAAAIEENESDIEEIKSQIQGSQHDRH